ncbi:hypothetical protein [Halotalea alkalilenta]|uniref:hypothetical protein n=1 Tax=Halotalea alkalilenta TaxID=376489 RepID=UPI0007D05940|nr:hypothetical protein [Halotalea alkalilenta]
MPYPEIKRVYVVDEHFGTKIADPYRWLENDAKCDPDVAAWVAAQNQLTRAFLAELPGRELLRERLTTLFDHERLTAPQERGNRYFFTRNAGLDDQALLVAREGVSGSDRVLIDPNGWAEDGSGFFYSSFSEPGKGTTPKARVDGHAVYFHALGTSQKADRLVHATPEQPYLVHVAGMTDDGRYLVTPPPARVVAHRPSWIWPVPAGRRAHWSRTSTTTGPSSAISGRSCSWLPRRVQSAERSCPWISVMPSRRSLT